MKVKFVCEVFADDLERSVNECIRDKRVVDIKVSMNEHYFTALIMYEEEE